MFNPYGKWIFSHFWIGRRSFDCGPLKHRIIRQNLLLLRRQKTKQSAAQKRRRFFVRAGCTCEYHLHHIVNAQANIFCYRQRIFCVEVEKLLHSLEIIFIVPLFLHISIQARMEQSHMHRIEKHIATICANADMKFLQWFGYSIIWLWQGNNCTQQ